MTTPPSFRINKKKLATAAAASVSLIITLGLLTGCSGDSGNASASASATAIDESLFPNDPATGSPITMGVVWAEGGATTDNPEVGDVVGAAVDYINNNMGGIAGHKVVAVTCKSQETVPSATDCANQMVQANVDVFVATVSGYVDTMVPIITGAGIPYVTAAAGGATEIATPGVYSLTGGLSALLPGMATFAKQNNWSDVTAFTGDAPAAVSGVKLVGSPSFAAQNIGLTLQSIPTGTADATAQVASGLKDNPGGVAIIADGPTCISTLQALQTLGTAAKAMFPGSCLTPTVANSIGSYLNGQYLFAAGDPYTDAPEAVLYRQIVAKYAPQTPTIYGNAVFGYQAVLGMARVVGSTLTGDPTNASIKTAIQTAKNVPLPAGDGMTVTCDGTAIPGFPTACSNGVLYGEVSGDGATVASMSLIN